MVVTQEAPFSGWKGMNPKLIPKFEEGQQEGIARDLLDGLLGVFALFEPPDLLGTMDDEGFATRDLDIPSCTEYLSIYCEPATGRIIVTVYCMYIMIFTKKINLGQVSNTSTLYQRVTIVQIL